MSAADGLEFTPGGTCICQDDPDAAWAAVLDGARSVEARAAALAAREYGRVAALSKAQALPGSGQGDMPGRGRRSPAWQAVPALVDVFAPHERQAARSAPDGRIVLAAWPDTPPRGNAPLITLGLDHAEARRLFHALGRALGEVRP